MPREFLNKRMVESCYQKKGPDDGIPAAVGEERGGGSTELYIVVAAKVGVIIFKA